jgi:Cu+-exporting ATPase
MDSSTTAIDPVCGMEVDPQQAAGASEYGGTSYYFCSTGCKRQFDRDPATFTGPQSSTPAQQPNGSRPVRLSNG